MHALLYHSSYRRCLARIACSRCHGSHLSFKRQFSRSAFLNGHSAHNPEPIAPSLKGKSCIITGASRGIGAEIARRFAKEGVECILVGRNEKSLYGIKDELIVGDEMEHRVVVGDVGDMDFWKGMKKEVYQKKVHILVNAAGVTHYSPLFITSPSLLEEVLRTNLMGTMMACRTVGKNMMASRGGCIINVASLLGMKGGKGSAAYAASKAGVIGLTRALAAELGEKNVRVNVIVPGYVETDMTEGMSSDARSEAINAIPLKRFGQPSEIAHAAVFLAANTYANNCVLNLDGGLSAI
ncbi:NAD(P)-binding protein [Mollisia scopiformis]|uniref:NAD(P)-binding protein n=1 Tax=Mollisia scopiformis TaxID=149040 RepID=A0A194XSF4_MOLSC|nr:NAD(P)-binding protein [Mollisia scopiformis]KUJ23128.1 NAD(P)-binding protein [Mollisia scopiformis]